MDNLTTGNAANSRVRSTIGIITMIGLSTAYCVAFFAQPVAWWPALVRRASLSISRTIYSGIDATLGGVGFEHISRELRGGVYLCLTGILVPWLLLGLFGRGRPRDIGFRRPNGLGWRLILTAYFVAVPFLVWMVYSPDFGRYYLPQLKRAGAASFYFYYFVNMMSEHFFFHGVLLGVLRPGCRWPATVPASSGEGGKARRIMQWFGVAQPTYGARGIRRLSGWLGLPEGCLPAVCASAALFGVIHIGKDPRELLLSVPGGIALGFVAYRANSWLAPFILHLATAATACAMMLALA